VPKVGGAAAPSAPPVPTPMTVSRMVSAMVPVDRVVSTFYRLSIITMSPSAAV